MQVMLVLFLIMPGEIPDKQTHVPVKTMEECWAKAQKYTAGDPKDAEGIGLGAACIWKKEGSDL